jgi:helicase MOV-10
MFHAISGNDEREASSPSYFNRHEASQVKNYVKILLAGRDISAYI